MSSPIDKLREALSAIVSEAIAGNGIATQVAEARAALDELTAQLAEASAVNDRIATILDEAVSMMPVMPAQEALTLLEEHVHSLRMAVEIAQQREPTQAEGDAHARRPPSGAPDDAGDMLDECFVAAGGWTGRRCRVCRRWVWGGPTACAQCVAAEERAQLSAQPKALGHLHCRECNYHPREPINCAHCGAVYCMTRESLPAKGGSDG